MTKIKFGALCALLSCLLTACSESSNNEEATYLVTDMTTLTFENGGGSLRFMVESNANWTITTADDWMSVTPQRGNGNQQVTVTVADLLNPLQVEGTLTIRTDDGSKMVNVSVKVKGVIQDYPAENNRVLRVTNGDVHFSDLAHDQDSLAIISNIAWELRGPEWVEAWDGSRWRPLSMESGNVYGMGSQKVPVRSAANHDADVLREGQLTVSERMTGNYAFYTDVRQAGRYSVMTNVMVRLDEGFGMNWKCGKEVTTVYYNVFEKKPNSSSLVADEIRSWKKADPGSGVGFSGLKANTLYYVEMFSEESLRFENPAGFMYAVYTASSDNQPVATVNQILLYENYWVADVTMSENAWAYVVLEGRDGDSWINFNNPLLALWMTSLARYNENYFRYRTFNSSGYIAMMESDNTESEIHCATWAMGSDGSKSGVLKHYSRRLNSSAPARVAGNEELPLKEVMTKEDVERLNSSVRLVRRY